MKHTDIDITFKVRGGTECNCKEILIYANGYHIGCMDKAHWHQNRGWGISLNKFGLYSRSDFGGNPTRGKELLKEIFANGSNEKNHYRHEKESQMIGLVRQFVKDQEESKGANNGQ